MSKKNEKIKAEMHNDIRKTVKQDKIKIQIRKKKIIKTVGILAVLILLALLITFIVLSRKIKVKDEDVLNYNYFLTEEEGRYGVIDKKGNIVIKPEYDYIQIPDPERSVFICLFNYDENSNDYSSKVINENGEEILTNYENVRAIPRNNTTRKYLYQNKILSYQNNGKYGLINLNGEKITSAVYSLIETLDYKDGALKVCKNDKYGVIKLNGDTLVDAKYSSIISDGYYDEDSKYDNAGFIVSVKNDSGYKYGYLNQKGKAILDCEYNSINRISDIKDNNAAYLITSKNGKIGLNRNVQVKIKNEYEALEYDDINKIVIVQKSGKYGVNDLEGNMILPAQYEDLQVAGKIINATKEGRNLVFDSNGNLQKDAKYTMVLPTESENYFITATENGKYGLVDNNNDVLIDNKYDYIEYAFDNYFIFSNNGRTGVVDNSGNVVVQNQFDIIQHIHGTHIIQVIDSATNKSYILNKNIKPVAELIGAHIYIQENYVKIISNDNVIYLDFEGEIKESSELLSNNTIFAKEQDGKWGYVNSNGTAVIDFQYDLAHDINEYGYGAIKSDGKWGVISSDGEFILDPTYSIDDVEPIFIGEYYKISEDYEVSVFVK